MLNTLKMLKHIKTFKHVCVILFYSVECIGWFHAVCCVLYVVLVVLFCVSLYTCCFTCTCLEYVYIYIYIYIVVLCLVASTIYARFHVDCLCVRCRCLVLVVLRTMLSNMFNWFVLFCVLFLCIWLYCVV